MFVYTMGYIPHSLCTGFQGCLCGNAFINEVMVTLLLPLLLPPSPQVSAGDTPLPPGACIPDGHARSCHEAIRVWSGTRERHIVRTEGRFQWYVSLQL